jgi:hypothetical protein
MALQYWHLGVQPMGQPYVIVIEESNKGSLTQHKPGIPRP